MEPATVSELERWLEEEEGRSDDYNEAYKHAIVRAENAEANLVSQRAEFIEVLNEIVDVVRKARKMLAER